MTRLINADRAEIIGPIRQEILSGIKHERQHPKLREALQAYVDRPLSAAHYETAAEFSNTWGRKGIQGSATDFLICAVAVLDGLEIFTADADFGQFAKHIPIRLFRPT